MFLNQVNLAGYLGSDVEVRDTAEGKKIGILSLGITESSINTKKKKEEKTHWFKVVIITHSYIESIAEYLKKGTEVLVSGGRLDNKSWTDDAGKTHYRTEIIVDSKGSVKFSNKGKSKE